MTNANTDPAGLRPHPDALVIAGALVALAGYLLPWFRQSSGYSWSFSGWGYATLSSGGGWTLITIAWLVLALAAGIWAGRSVGAALTVLTGAVGGLVFAVIVVAASFSEFTPQGSINWIAGLPFGVGLPILAGGLGLLLAGGVRAVVRTSLLALGPTRT